LEPLIASPSISIEGKHVSREGPKNRANLSYGSELGILESKNAMFALPIDLLLTVAGYINYGLLFLVPVALLLGALLVKPLEQKNIRITPLLLAIRVFLVTVLVALFLYLLTTSGQINVSCTFHTVMSCQRERTLIYGLFKQETALKSLNPVKQHKTVSTGGNSQFEVILIDSGKSYLLHPTHTFSRLEQFQGSRYSLLDVDSALADMRLFAAGGAGHVRHYRDRIELFGRLISLVQVCAVLPVLLFIWLFSESHFGGIYARHR
jgi:hypothetical protein